MPDIIPDQSPMPYLLGDSGDAVFAFYGSGAIRRLGNTETVYLRDEQQVRTVGLDPTSTNNAVAVSAYLFNV